MSDITLDHLWPGLLLFSPLLGWPGLLIGGALGAWGWKNRRILGGVLGAVIGNFGIFFLRMMV